MPDAPLDNRPVPSLRDDPILAAAFDADFYLSRNADVARARVDPLRHYLKHGWREGRDPNPTFSTRYYAATHAPTGENPLLHWLQTGRWQGLPALPPEEQSVAGAFGHELARLRQAFDPAFYLAFNPDVDAAGIDPLHHYLTAGWKEGRDPRPDFSTSYYLANHDTDDADPLRHWLAKGRNRGLATRPPQDPTAASLALTPETVEALRAEFDAAFYLDTNPDVASAEVDPLEHYMQYGWREGRDPGRDFSTRYYLDRNPDIRDSRYHPFLHYVLYGRSEGRRAKHPDSYASAAQYAAQELGLDADRFARVERAFDAEFYTTRYPDLADHRDPLLHYLSSGWAELREPCAEFDPGFYTEVNGDIRESRTIPFLHWVLDGQDEGRPGRYTADTPPLPESIDWDACRPEDLAEIEGAFDPDFYMSTYPEVAEQGIDPARHFLLLGWRLGYDPRADFSTSYYRDRYLDIRKAGHNPFLHYLRHGRSEQRETRSHIDLRRQSYRPLVSVILPNYNHAPYLRQRIRSIAAQGYYNLEVIILDDCSPDDSRQVICDTVAELGLEARLAFNQVNSGNVFAQWRKGLSMATGDLVWICESDDFCEPDFLEHLVPAFADDSVNIAFGRIQFAEADGSDRPGLDAYREGAEPGIWDVPITRPAAEWFAGGFGVNNVIANVGGCVFRRMDLPEAVWDEAATYRICGDWFLYLHIAGPGQIAYNPHAVAYFRQHGQNTSASNFHQRYYYDENIRILRLLCARWGIPRQTRLRFLEKVKAQYRHFDLPATMGDFDTLFDVPALLDLPKTETHLQFCFLGFHPGGGELFPINLANAFARAGYLVSMLAVDLSTVNADMRARLDARIPVYHASHATARGRDGYLSATGTDLLNSHVASADAFLATLDNEPIERPWVATLHGSYVAFDEAPRAVIDWITGNVDRFIYTANRNLEFFERHGIAHDDFVKLPNAMPRDERPAPFERADLGIAEDDTVFVLVARGIRRKGWRAAIHAFRDLRARRADAHLLLVGEGEATDDARESAADLPGVHFLGYQSEINGIYRLSDCMVLPTRFEGESYPLCLIQALQEGLPSIVTDLGEIRAMMTDDSGATAGLLLDNTRESDTFFADLASAMEAMCDPATRAGFAATARTRAQLFDIDRLVTQYEGIFDDATLHHEARSRAQAAE